MTNTNYERYQEILNNSSLSLEEKEEQICEICDDDYEEYKTFSPDGDELADLAVTFANWELFEYLNNKEQDISETVDVAIENGHFKFAVRIHNEYGILPSSLILLSYAPMVIVAYFSEFMDIDKSVDLEYDKMSCPSILEKKDFLGEHFSYDKMATGACKAGNLELLKLCVANGTVITEEHSQIAYVKGHIDTMVMTPGEYDYGYPYFKSEWYENQSTPTPSEGCFECIDYLYTNNFPVCEDVSGYYEDFSMCSVRFFYFRVEARNKHFRK